VFAKPSTRCFFLAFPCPGKKGEVSSQARLFANHGSYAVTMGRELRCVGGHCPPRLRCGHLHRAPLQILVTDLGKVSGNAEEKLVELRQI
jgi:hypothetical protein